MKQSITRKLYLTFSFLIFAFSITQAQTTPPGIPYQAIARNANGTPYVNANLTVRFSLHEQTATGTLSYAETNDLQTNDLGLFSTTFGSGTPITGTFAGINWAQTTKFLQVEINLGSAWVDMGTQQLMSVPYAMYAAKGPTGPQGPVGVTIVSNSGDGIWCCGPTHTVPAGKLWKIVGYTGLVRTGLLNGETWLDEGQSITFQGSGVNGASIPYSFIAFEYTKSSLDFSVVSNFGDGIWCCGPTHTVPAGKLWKIVGYTGLVRTGLLNGETWLDEGQSITFQGSGGNGASIPYSFIAFEYFK
jgi:hypothetical protein